MRNTHAVPSCSSVESLRTSRTPHAISSCSSFESLRDSRTPQDFLTAIQNTYPCPTLSGFERAAWLYECRTAARWIANITDAEYKRQLAAIEEAGMTSDTYEIIPIERTESRVNVDLLRQKHPDVFAELVHISAPNAQKIIGHRTLYELARDKVGEAALREYETVNVKDLERVMLPQIASGFISVETKVMDWAVLEIEEGTP